MSEEYTLRRQILDSPIISHVEEAGEDGWYIVTRSIQIGAGTILYETPVAIDGEKITVLGNAERYMLAMAPYLGGYMHMAYDIAYSQTSICDAEEAAELVRDHLDRR